MKYKNSLNNYEVTDGSCLSWLWCMLLGPLYFAFRGNWSWFFIFLILLMSTFGLAIFIVPFFARKINRIYLLRKGYAAV